MLLSLKSESPNRSYFARVLFFCLGSCLAYSCGPDIPIGIEEAFLAIPKEIDYNQHVRPILSDRCFFCHGPDQNKLEAGLRLDIAERATGELPDHPGKYAIVPKSIAKSELVHRIISEEPEFQMPPPESKLELSEKEKAILIRWIKQGAEYKEHWAFISPAHSPPPAVENEEWANNEIDLFVLDHLEQSGLQPQEQATKELLIRRVSLDLTGLPPTIDEIDAFLQDSTKDAYEKLVDRLLASPHYGEHVAVDWLDLARYADTHGYSVDRYRDMSPWRDWVIKALNDNMPYDKFVEWQLAGDLLPNPTREQILATGFNRNHAQNMEGGIVPEEFRVEYVSDRTNTLGKAFLGLTLECARCHDHKYDPISQEEYFQLFAYFNNVNEVGQISWNNATPVPTLLMSSKEVDNIVTYLDQQIDSLERVANQHRSTAKQSFDRWLMTRPMLPKRLSKTVAVYDFERMSDGTFRNSKAPYQKATYINTVSKKQYIPEIIPGYSGNGVLLNGDEALEFGQIGKFNRHEPFTVSIRTWIPKELHDGVIFHKGIGAIIYNFRGYHLALNDGKLQLMMAHTAPNNAIIEHTRQVVPREEWIHLALTYDGSSSASGLRIFIDGIEQETEIEIDNLFKTILFNQKDEPGLKVGARWRGIGLKGAKVDDFAVFDRALHPIEIDHLAGGNLMNELVSNPSEINPENRTQLERYYVEAVHDTTIVIDQALMDLRAKRNQAIDTVKEVMVMEEMSRPRPTFVLNRGAYDAPGAQVAAHTPAKLSKPGADQEPNRLGLARWLMQPDHPLTARVVVNRYWQKYFGQGLVKTADDFGSQGSLPSHPKLLDFLSIYFIESNWDVKAFQKFIVMSATYRQSSSSSAELRKIDPDNFLLARGPSVRLRGEVLRDHALASSGLLSTRIGGKSVKPYQPAGLWKMNGGKYQRDSGEALYRRSLYTFWKRTVPHPTLSTFDVPNRANCEVKRQKTSTPLQALVLLNDPTYIESCRALAAKMLPLETKVEAIQMAFRSLTGRRPSSDEMRVLTSQYDTDFANFELAPEKMQGWLQMGEYRTREDQVSPQLAAYSVVASTILNSDAFIYKR
ncbi:MAG: DUF1553 domain-containing protein [Saprospiraceae bacterium]|nr:DUF1553 domain-containing protein [Saprospiraceae bacterium]